MIYLIVGQQNISLRSQMKAIIKKSIKEIDPMNFVKHDGTISLVQDIVDEANSLPLGYDKKAVVVDNCYFLLKNKDKAKIDSGQDFKKLIKYIEHPDESCDLIFLVNIKDNEVNKKSEIYQAIEKHGTIAFLDEPDEKNWHQVVARYFKERWPNVTIDSDAVNELARRTEGDYSSLFNNGAKLALYTNTIHFEDVTLMVTRPLEENSFLLYRYLVDEKNMDAVSLFRDLKDKNVEPVTLISLLANEFRLLSRVSYLAKKRYTNEQIAEELKIKPGRVMFIRKNSMVVSQKKINETLEELYNLDLQIKSGLVDRFYAFELFLINFKRN